MSFMGNKYDDASVSFDLAFCNRPENPGNEKFSKLLSRVFLILGPTDLVQYFKSTVFENQKFIYFSTLENQ